MTEHVRDEWGELEEFIQQGGRVRLERRTGEIDYIGDDVVRLIRIARAAKEYIDAEESIARGNRENMEQGGSLGPFAPPPVREKQRLREALLGAAPPVR